MKYFKIGKRLYVYNEEKDQLFEFVDQKWNQTNQNKNSILQSQSMNLMTEEEMFSITNQDLSNYQVRLDDLYSILLYNHGLGVLDSMPITARGGIATLCWNRAQSSIEYSVFWHNRSSYDHDEGNFYSTIDYLTYIPYANQGYLYFQKLLQEKGLTVPSFRYKIIEKILGKDLTTLPYEQIQVIQRFFEEYQKEDLNLLDIQDVSILICRLYHQVESCYRLECNMTDEEFELKSDLLFTDVCFDESKIQISEVLNQYPQTPPLKEEDILFLKQYFDKLWHRYFS